MLSVTFESRFLVKLALDMTFEVTSLCVLKGRKNCPSKRRTFVKTSRVLLATLLIILTTEAAVATSNNTTPVPRITGFQTAPTKKFEYPEPVRNLTVTTHVYNASKGLLQLAISWKPPTEGVAPSSYNVHVKPSNLTDNLCNKSFPYYNHINDKDASNTSVPDFLDVVHEIRIIPGCSYRIVVESNPHNGKKNASLYYTVPECVGEVCSCRHAEGLPMPTKVQARILDSRNITTTWSLSALRSEETANITKFLVSFGHQIFKNRPPYNMSPAGEVKYNTSIALDAQYSLLIVSPTDLRPNVTYKVEVSVLDTKGCRGPVANHIFTMPAQPLVQSSPPPVVVGNASLQRVLVTVLPVLSFVVVCILAAAMLWQRCGNCIRRKLREGRLQQIHSWRGIYKVINNDSSTSRITNSFPILHQERNVIYVEQEIEEAKARGDADTFEVSYDRLELGRQIGKGAFGRVFLARAEAIAGISGYITVAVKKLKNKASADEVEEFLSEIAMMKRVGRHPNVVRMVGCCTLKQPYCMLMEYVPCGDLLQYLRQLRVEYERRTGGAFAISSTMIRPVPRYVDLQLPLTDSEGSYIQPETQMTASTGRPSIAETEWSFLTSDCATVTTTTTDITPRRRLEYVLDPKELQSFAIQIARGMAHLERKQITHRDLAARNVLIDENKTLKISDFGLSRTGIYINTKRKKVPLRWLSVEAMRDNLYSSKSDVWAFAIVLWEIGTLGGFPYPTVGDMDLLNFLLEGKRLEKPDNCSDELYALMLQCWSHSADFRPSFAELEAHLDSVICRKRVYVDFTTLKPDYSFPPTEQQTQQSSNGKSSK